MKKKITEQDKIEANNLLEKAAEIAEPCIACGICKSASSAFRITKEESSTPRGIALLAKEKVLDDAFFRFPLDGFCKKVCPLKIDIDEAVLSVREAMVLRGKWPKEKKKEKERKEKKTEEEEEITEENGKEIFSTGEEENSV